MSTFSQNKVFKVKYLVQKYLVTATLDNLIIIQLCTEYLDVPVFRYILADLKSDKFKQLETCERISHIIYSYTAILSNLLLNDELLTESVPLLETNGVAEVIQHYMNSKCVTKFLKQLKKIHS